MRQRAEHPTASTASRRATHHDERYAAPASLVLSTGQVPTQAVAALVCPDAMPYFPAAKQQSKGQWRATSKAEAEPKPEKTSSHATTLKHTHTQRRIDPQKTKSPSSPRSLF